jgi:hypothetical protein
MAHFPLGRPRPERRIDARTRGEIGLQLRGGGTCGRCCAWWPV